MNSYSNVFTQDPVIKELKCVHTSASYRTQIALPKTVRGHEERILDSKNSIFEPQELICRAVQKFL